MPRPDLLALTEDGLIQLSNAGLVKRAARDLASGAGPAVEETGDGALEARFGDGTLTRLPPGRQLADAACTCPASGMCRHRVTLALAYKALGDGGAGTSSAAERSWNPGALDLDAYEASLGAAAKKELTRLVDLRIDVRLERGAVPSARLPMATVRFLVPDDVGYARCDCASGTACAHIALGLRAFREAGDAEEVTIGRRTAPAAAGEDDLTAALDAVLVRLLDAGVAAGASAHAQTLDRARRAAGAAGAVQVALGLEALAEQIAAYEARSARHDEFVCLALCVELFARPRAGDRVAALGIGEPMETEMGKARLVSLGARLRAEGEDMRVALLLADSDTGATMLLEKLFSPLPSEAGKLAQTIGRRQLTPGLPVAGAARGQILTSAARRRADGLLALGSGARGRTALTPRDAVFGFLAPLKVAHAGALAARFAGRAPSFLRPRRRIDEAHVFDVEEVLGQSWTSGGQLWQGAVRLRDGGGTLWLERSYDAGAPRALDALSGAFDGRHGPIRQISGPVRVEGGALVCDPWSLGADRFVAPDVDAAEAGSSAIPLLGGSSSSTPLDKARSLLAGAVHAGRRAREGFGPKQAAEAAAAFDAAGYRTTAERLRGWAEAPPDDVAAFGAAAVWLAALAEDDGA